MLSAPSAPVDPALLPVAPTSSENAVVVVDESSANPGASFVDVLAGLAAPKTPGAKTAAPPAPPRGSAGVLPGAAAAPAAPLFVDDPTDEAQGIVEADPEKQAELADSTLIAEEEDAEAKPIFIPAVSEPQSAPAAPIALDLPKPQPQSKPQPEPAMTDDAALTVAETDADERDSSLEGAEPGRREAAAAPRHEYTSRQFTVAASHYRSAARVSAAPRVESSSVRMPSEVDPQAAPIPQGVVAESHAAAGEAKLPAKAAEPPASAIGEGEEAPAVFRSELATVDPRPLPVPKAPTSRRNGVEASEVKWAVGETSRATDLPASSPITAPEFSVPATAPAAVPEGAARFAGVPLEEGSEDVASMMSALEKTTQTIAEQLVKPSLARLGIDPAEVRSTMEIVAPDLSASASAAPDAAEDASLMAGATRTVERVLRTVDMMRVDDRPGVHLRLDFGDSGPLSVHISLRNGQVHTLFRSDSADIRETLSTAWSNFAQQGDSAGLPLAEPVLLPMRPGQSGSAEGDRSLSQFSQGHPDARSGRESAEAGERQGGLVRGSRRRAPAVIAAPAVNVSPRASNHLSVLA